MALIPLSEFVSLAKAAGFSGTALATITAIALREAPGPNGTIDSSAVNPTAVNGEHASGALQFLPSTLAAYANPFMPVDPFDLQAELAAAYNVFSQTGGFGPWTCDTECGQPAGQGVTPTSPSTVLTGNGKPVTLPSDFAAVTGYSGGSLSNPIAPSGGGTQAGGGTPNAPSQSSGSGNINFGPFSIPTNFLQNVGVGALGIAILLGGFLVLASPTINEQVIQPAKKATFS